MRAVRFDRFGPPAEVLSVADVPWPDRAGGDVLVRVAAAGVNPSDVKNVGGSMHHLTTLPRTPGRDFAGTVVDGPGELNGTDVFGTGGDLGFTRDGTHAEFVAVPAAAVVAKPAWWSMPQAAAAGVTFVTAAAALTSVNFAAADTVLVTGATGGVGSAAVQVARWCGARVIAAVRRPEQADGVRAIGATEVVIVGERPLAEAVRALTSGAGVSVVVDTVGGPLFEPALASLADRGRMAVMTASVGPGTVALDVLSFYRRQLRLVGVNTLSLDSAACAGALRSLSAGFADGQLQPPGDLRVMPLAEAAAAYAAVGGGGRVVLVA